MKKILAVVFLVSIASTRASLLPAQDWLSRDQLVAFAAADKLPAVATPDSRLAVAHSEAASPQARRNDAWRLVAGKKFLPINEEYCGMEIELGPGSNEIVVSRISGSNDIPCDTPSSHRAICMNRRCSWSGVFPADPAYDLELLEDNNLLLTLESYMGNKYSYKFVHP